MRLQAVRTASQATPTRKRRLLILPQHRSTNETPRRWSISWFTEMGAESTQLVRFYARLAPDDRGRFLEEIQGWSDLQLERTHDYIQWLFPLTKRSAFNPSAPILDAKAISEFRSRPKLRANFRAPWFACWPSMALSWLVTARSASFLPHRSPSRQKIG